MAKRQKVKKPRKRLTEEILPDILEEFSRYLLKRYYGMETKNGKKTSRC